MSEFMTRLSVSEKNMEENLSNIAKNHMDFERIHPFADGNGRTGRMILNQQLINEKLLPIIIEPKGNYCQAFRRYDRSGDISQMVHIIAKGELASIERIRQLYERKNNLDK